MYIYCSELRYVITLSAFVLNWGKLSEVKTVLVLVEKWLYSYCKFVLLTSLFFRDVAELEKVSFWKFDKILPPGVLLACKQVQRIAYILPSVWAS
jgi:hypothetical protein